MQEPKCYVYACRVQYGLCFTNVPLLSGGPQLCLPVLTNGPRLLCLPKGPTLHVLTNAPRLSVSVWTGPKFVSVLTNALRLSVFSWRFQSGLCSLMHQFCLEGPNLFSCAHFCTLLLCLPEGPN